MKTCNDKKKVCIIRSNPVKPDSRVEKEAWALARSGYDVMVLAWDRDNNHDEESGNINVLDVEIPIIRLGYKATFGEGFKNIIPYLKFQFHMCRWLRKNKFDIVHACDFDTAFFSIGIVKINKEKFVFDIFDFLYGEPSNLFQNIIKKIQLQIINFADATIICTEERKLQIKGSKPRKLGIIHNAPSALQISKLNSSKQNDNVIRVVYVGILQDDRLLIEIAECILKMENVELHIGGFGKYEDYFKDLSNKCQQIFFYGRISYDKTLELENSCDIMLAIYNPMIENHRYAAPNKFYESLLLGKPVIMAKGTGMSQIIEQNNIGEVIDYSEDGFFVGLTKLINRKNEWDEIADKMKEIYLRFYSWDIMEERLISIYNQL